MLYQCVSADNTFRGLYTVGGVYPARNLKGSEMDKVARPHKFLMILCDRGNYERAHLQTLDKARVLTCLADPDASSACFVRLPE
jgi:hypothetical protein